MRGRRLVLLTAAVLAAAAPAADAAPRTCRSADLRYAYAPGQPERFGVFALTAAGTSCTTARRVARAWMAGYERAGIAPRRAAGFTFTALPARAPQELRRRARRGDATVRFVYRVANG